MCQPDRQWPTRNNIEAEVAVLVVHGATCLKAVAAICLEKCRGAA